MKLSIGYRTIKTAVGTAIAIMLAQMFGLENFASAGILTILCIKVTKKKSFRASWDRLLACFIGMFLATVLFEVLSYHPLIIGLLLLIFIPIVVKVKAKDGIASSAVIILHIYSAGDVTIGLLLNELGIVIIGIGVALLANMYMPSLDKKLKEYQLQIEENFQHIFQEIVMFLRTNESNWDGKEITETYQLIERAKSLSLRDVENHFLRNENFYYVYFNMRGKQFEIIERVLPIVTSIPLTLEQGEMIADFIEELSESIHPGNTADIFLEKLSKISKTIKDMELPKTREEFEARAALLHFKKEMEEYLIIKSSFIKLDDKRIVKEGSAI